MLSLGGGVIKETIVDGGRGEPGASLAYLHDMAAEMGDMASGLGFPMIVYLLQMTVLEILETIEREKADRRRRE